MTLEIGHQNKYLHNISTLFTPMLSILANILTMLAQNCYDSTVRSKHFTIFSVVLNLYRFVSYYIQKKMDNVLCLRCTEMSQIKFQLKSRGKMPLDFKQAFKVKQFLSCQILYYIVDIMSFISTKLKNIGLSRGKVLCRAVPHVTFRI